MNLSPGMVLIRLHPTDKDPSVGTPPGDADSASDSDSRAGYALPTLRTFHAGDPTAVCFLFDTAFR